jgi:AraC-like DNA-binding protein
LDPLTHLIEMLRPRSFLWKQLIARGAWEWRFPALDGVVFGCVVSGCCRFEVPGGGEHEMGQGDYLLLANPRPWFLRGGEGAAVSVDFDTAYAEMGNEDLLADARPGQGEEEVTRMVAGHFEFDSVNAGLLASLLSPVVLLPAGQRGERELLSRVLTMIEAEATSDGPGREAVMSRLLEIMLIELLRTPQLASSRRGMLSGLADPPIAAALRAFHSDIQVPWSVAMMATEARLSRSAFSDRFTSVVGEPAMTYVLNWRMAVARDALAAGRKSVAQVAAATGYGSVSAFSTAFSRVVGVSPMRYAQGALSATA